MKIVKLNNQFYIDKDVYDLVTKLPEHEIKDGDSIFFTKNAKFPRNLLFVSDKKFTRTIKFAKADVIVTSKFPNWWVGRAMYYHKTTSVIDNNYTADSEEVWCLHSMPVKDVETVIQLVAIHTENPTVRFVADVNAIKYINSGVTLTPDNVEDFAGIYNGDRELFYQMMKNINVSQCLPSTIYLLCNLLRMDRAHIYRNLPTIAPQVGSVLKSTYFDQRQINDYLLKTEYKDNIIQTIVKELVKTVDGQLRQYNLKTVKIEVDEVSL